MKTYVPLLLLLTLFFFACSSDDSSAFHRTPNESSELALLMRQMYDDIDTARAQLLRGERITVEIDHGAMLTAQGTEPEKVASDAYKIFSESYLATLAKFKKAKPVEVENAYEDLISSCINCHQQLCPGPVRRINNLSLPGAGI